MKKLLFCTLSLIFVNQISIAQNRSIKFEEKKFNELVQKAKSENKLIFIDAYTTWCGPCKWMAKTMFTNDSIADYFNANFINAKFDMEKGEGIELAKKFEVRCYPNLLFVNGDGELVHRSAGAARNVSDYIKMGETAKNPTESFGALLKSYDSKKKDPVFVKKMIEVVSTTCLLLDSYVSDYFNTQNQDDFTSKHNWEMIYDYVNDYESQTFQYLLNNRSLFESKFNKDSISLKISSTFEKAGNKILNSKDFTEEKYNQFTAKIDQMKFDGKESVLFHLELNRLGKKQDWNKLFDYAFKNGKDYLSIQEANSLCWNIYEKSDDKGHLKEASLLMKKVTETPQGRNWAYMDTYASVLFKMKNKADAQKVAKDAIELAKKEGVSPEEYKATEDLLEKINKL